MKHEVEGVVIVEIRAIWGGSAIVMTCELFLCLCFHVLLCWALYIVIAPKDGLWIGGQHWVLARYSASFDVFVFGLSDISEFDIPREWKKQHRFLSITTRVLGCCHGQKEEGCMMLCMCVVSHSCHNWGYRGIKLLYYDTYILRASSLIPLSVSPEDSVDSILIIKQYGSPRPPLYLGTRPCHHCRMFMYVPLYLFHILASWTPG